MRAQLTGLWFFHLLCLCHQAWSPNQRERFQPLPDLHQGGVAWWVTSWRLRLVWTLQPKPLVCLSSTSTTSCFQVLKYKYKYKDKFNMSTHTWLPGVEVFESNTQTKLPVYQWSEFFCLPCPPLQVSPSHLRWPWPSCWHSCMTASCPRATSPSTWRSNWAPRSSLTLAFPRLTPSRGYALRKVPKTCSSTVLKEQFSYVQIIFQSASYNSLTQVRLSLFTNFPKLTWKLSLLNSAYI